MSHGNAKLEREIVQIFSQDHLIVPFLNATDGSVAMNVDGSSTPVRFEAHCVAPSGKVCIVQRIVLLIETGTKMAPDEFGDQSALTNGIVLTAENSDNQVYNNFFRTSVKNNAEFALYTGTGFSGVAGGPTAGLTDAQAVNIALDQLGFQVILDKGDQFVFTVNDDLTDLDAMAAMMHGYFAPGVLD